MSTHLNALQLRLSNEHSRLQSTTTERERELRLVWIAQIEAEIAREREFEAELLLSDDELLAALSAA